MPVKNPYIELDMKNVNVDQAKKSAGRMPRYQEPKKDVASCEKPW